MPEDGTATPVESTGTVEPATTVADAPVETPGDSGHLSVEERHAGFLEAVEKGTAEAPKVDTPKPEQPKPPAEEAKTEVPDAPEPEEDDEDSEVDLLTDEDIDKHKTAPKSLRNYAKSLTKKFGPIVQAVDELGGVEAVKRLDRLQTLVMSAPDSPDHPDVTAYLDDLRKTNPQFASQLNTNVFYGALDESPELLDHVIKSELGQNWDRERLQTVAKLVDEGEIDVEAVIAEAKDRLSPEERARKDAEAEATRKEKEATAARIAELEKGQADRAEETKQIAIKSDVETLSKTFSDAREPVLRQFKLLPVDGEPDEIRTDKEYLIKKLITLTSMELGNSPLMATINRKIESQQKGDDYAWAVEKATSAYKSKFRELAMREAKYFAAYLKSYNQPAAANTKERRPEPLVDGSAAAPRTPTPTEQAQQPLSPEERRAAFQRRLEQDTGT